MKDSKVSLAHIAAKNNDLEMMKLLVKYKIDLETTDQDGGTPIFVASEHSNTDMIKYMIEQGVNLDHKDHQNRNIIYWVLLDAGCDPNIKSKLGRSAISKACWNGYVDVVRCLLETGKILLDDTDKHGRTCLHNAVWGESGGRLGQKSGACQSDSPECAQLVLEYGANVNFRDNSGNTPLNIACSTGGINSIRILLSFGADINEKNNYGSTPFLKACFRGHYECCKILYEYKELDPYARTRYGYTPLELAIEVGRDRILQWIIDEKVKHNKEYPGLELDQVDKIKLLHHAVNNPENSSNTLKDLLEYIQKNHPEVIDECFISVLHRALLRKASASIKTLLDFHPHHIKFDEPILEASVHLKSLEIFQYILSHYSGWMPQICLQSVVFVKNEDLLSALLTLHSFQNPEEYEKMTEIPS